MAKKFGIIGCGNMARPLVLRIYAEYSDIEFYTYTPSQTKAIELAKEVNGYHVKEITDFPKMDFWFLACKPQQLKDVAINFTGILDGQNIISVLASTSIATLKSHLNSDKIFRLMPNTPSLLGKGIELFHFAPNCGSEDVEYIKTIFKACGQIVVTKSEEELDELTAYTGSGPAYVFRFALAFQKDLEARGYPKELSRELVNNLFVGASELMSVENIELQKLVDNVTSKGGVTIEAIKVLEKNNLDESAKAAIDAALERGKQISQDLN